MSFSLALSDGDLLQDGSQLAIVYGPDKLKQDLTLWCTERYGIDRFHPMMGSNLQNYIGGMINYSTRSMVYAEMLRVLNNYQRVQFQSLRATPTLFSLSELLWSINVVDVSVDYQTVAVNINVSNGEYLSQVVSINTGYEG